MSGIRVSICSHEHVSEKLLHSYFANPNNGGGKIASIHYPMFGGHTAVIVFEDEDSKHIVGSRLDYVFAVGNAILLAMTRKACNRREIPIPKTELRKTKLTIRYLYNVLRKHIVSRVSSCFPIGGHSVTRTWIKYENVHKVQTVQNSTPKHNLKSNGTTTGVLPRYDQ